VKSNRPSLRSLNLFRSARRAKQNSGWRKTLDAGFRMLGLSWQAAPVRRLLQALCLGLYFYLFFYVCWPYTRLFVSQAQSIHSWLPVEAFLWIDPLVGLSTAIAARMWNVALLGMAGILFIGLVFPRAFCGYLCPLGSLIDLTDFLIWKRLPRMTCPQVLRWSNLRFGLLVLVLAAALSGILLSGFVAAIPILTRGVLFSAGNLQLGFAKNWGMVPPFTGAVWFSLALFSGVFLLGLLGPRFWCRYVCPSGALLSLPSLLARSKRRVHERCTTCGTCLKVCSFNAIQPDLSTHALSCTFCQTCGGVCPVEAIDFALITGSNPNAKEGSTWGQPLTRRALLSSAAGGAAAALLTRTGPASATRAIRPPGSVSEEQFLDLCIRCEQCLKICPGPVLQAAGLDYGFEALWTPVAVFSHAGCHQDCNFCTQVCPTGAITPLALAEKRHSVIGLAVIDSHTCLPHRGERDCQLCFDECNAAGYRAIEMRPIQLATGPIPEGIFSPEQIEQMGRILAPFVKADACVGCGLCEYRCHSAWVSQQQVLKRSAVVVKAQLRFQNH
jgi:ferredoxin